MWVLCPLEEQQGLLTTHWAISVAPYSNLLKLHLLVYAFWERVCGDVSLCLCGGQRTTFRSHFFSFHQVYSGDHTGVIRLGNKCLYIWSHLISLVVFILRRFTKATQLAVFPLQPLKWLGLQFMLTAIVWGCVLNYQSEGKMYVACVFWMLPHP